MSNVIGDENGIAVLRKLAKSETPVVKEYYARLMNNSVSCNFKKLFFSDFEEQLKKIINNQTIFSLSFNSEKNVWNVEHFLTPK